MPIGMSRWGLIASCAAVETASKPIYAKKTTAAPRKTPLQPNWPGPRLGGISAPSGLFAVTQLAVLTNQMEAKIKITTMPTLMGIVPCPVELCEASAAVNDVKRPSPFEQQRDCL